MGEYHGIDAMRFGLGFGGGILWPATFLILMYGVRDFGLSLAGSASRLSLLVPVLFAVFFLQETLTRNTLLGIFCALFVLLLMTPLRQEKNGTLNLRALWFFPLMVFSLGCVTLWLNVFNTNGQAQQYLVFISFVFSFSLAWPLV